MKVFVAVMGCEAARSDAGSGLCPSGKWYITADLNEDWPSCNAPACADLGSMSHDREGFRMALTKFPLSLSSGKNGRLPPELDRLGCAALLDTSKEAHMISDNAMVYFSNIIDPQLHVVGTLQCPMSIVEKTIVLKNLWLFKLQHFQISVLYGIEIYIYLELMFPKTVNRSSPCGVTSLRRKPLAANILCVTFKSFPFYNKVSSLNGWWKGALCRSSGLLNQP